MTLMEKIKGMDQRFSWSFFSFLLAVIFGVISVYLGFIKVDRPDLNFIIKSNFSVLDIKEKVGQLDVFYEGESLNKKGEDLRVITFDVVNQGSSPLLPGYYDQNSPVGFEITNGVIADAPVLVLAANDYIKENLVMVKVGESKVVFSNIIIEPGESFSIKVLILHDADKSPGIIPVGKVAGVSKIDLISDYASVERKPSYEIAFGGGWAVTFYRTIIFGVFFCSILFFILFLTIKLEGVSERKRRRKLVAVFKEYEHDRISVKDEYLFNSYVKHGKSEVMSICLAILENNYKDLLIDSVTGDVVDKTPYYKMKDRDTLLMLVNEGVIFCEDGVYAVDQQRKKVIDIFKDYLIRKKELMDIDEISSIKNI